MTALYIGLSVICATLLFLLFKVFERRNVSTPHALIINYLVAAIFGVLLLPDPMDFFCIYNRSWFWMSCVLGIMFISLFYLMALISQKIGVSAASVATKMSVVIPVVAAVILYGDKLTVIEAVGILLSLVAVWLATKKNKAELAVSSLIWLPFVLFLGAGLLDTFLKLAENYLVPADEELFFIPSIFAMAFIAGIVLLPLLKDKAKSFHSQKNTWAGGILLGLVNYGSILFIWRALAQDGIESSMVFPVANIGVVACTTLSGWIIFREHLSQWNWVGILLSLISIVLITAL